MGQPAIQVEGLTELRRDLRRIQDEGLSAALKTANLKIAKAVIDRALPNVPVRTGRLKASVRGLGNLGGAVGKAGSASVKYAAAVHWKTGPRFLTDAAVATESDVVGWYQDEIDRVLEIINAA